MTFLGAGNSVHGINADPSALEIRVERTAAPEPVAMSSPSANRAQQRKTSIVSEGDEMQMAAPVVANDFVGHGKKKIKTPTLQEREDRPPETAKARDGKGPEKCKMPIPRR